MSEKYNNKNLKNYPKNNRNTQLDEVLNRTKKNLQQISLKCLNETSTYNIITNINSDERSPRNLDYYSIDNFESIKPKNFDINLILRSNNLQQKLTNESIIIKETNEDDDEKILIENDSDEKEKTKKIRIITNFTKKKKKKNKNNSDDDIPRILKKETNKKNPKKANKKLHKNISADKIFSKEFYEEEDSDKISTTTTCKKIKQKRINRLNSSSTNSSSKMDKFMETYERFKENQKQNQKKIEEMKKKKEIQEKNLCTNKPKINKNSKNIASKFQDDFFSRQKKMNDLKIQNTQLLKERLKKKEEEEISKSNILIKKNNNKGRNKSIKKEINTSIDKLFAWDSARKEKINNLKKSQEDKFKKENYNIPKINKNSYKITVNLKYSLHDPVKRLYEDDVQNRKAKKKILENVYGYSFIPNVDQKTKKKAIRKRKSIKSADWRRRNTSQSSDNYTEISRETNNEENDNLLRTSILERLFKKNKKMGKRNNSAINIKCKNYNPYAIDEESEELENENDEEKNENDNLYNNSTSSKEYNLAYNHKNGEIKKKKKKIRNNSII